MLEKIDKIASIIQAFTITLLSFFAFTQFRYKHDAEIRKMLIENYKKFEPISDKIIGEAEAPPELFKNFWEILNEAELCFHRELVDFIKYFREQYGKLYVTQRRLERPTSEEDRIQRIDTEHDLLLKSYEDLKKLKKLYRKQIIQESLWVIILDCASNCWQKLAIILNSFQHLVKEKFPQLNFKHCKTLNQVQGDE